MTDEEISNFLFLEDRDQIGDIAIALGIKNWWNPLNKAIKLYEPGSVKKILFTGGINRISGEYEAQSMYKEAVKRGLPEEDLLLEDGASNTLENVLFSKKVLEEKGLLKNIKSVCAIMANIHARRVMMTFKQNFPSDIKVKACPYLYDPHNWTKKSWVLDPIARKFVLREVVVRQETVLSSQIKIIEPKNNRTYQQYDSIHVRWETNNMSGKKMLLGVVEMNNSLACHSQEIVDLYLRNGVGILNSQEFGTSVHIGGPGSPGGACIFEPGQYKIRLCERDLSKPDSLAEDTCVFSAPFTVTEK